MSARRVLRGRRISHARQQCSGLRNLFPAAKLAAADIFAKTWHARWNDYQICWIYLTCPSAGGKKLTESAP